MIKLATVSPCYNEEEVLRHSVERLTTLFERMIAEGLISEDSMMVFVNDGSRDRTWEIISELHQQNRFVRGINLARNVGHQNAIMAGMMTARKWAGWLNVCQPRLSISCRVLWVWRVFTTTPISA